MIITLKDVLDLYEDVLNKEHSTYKQGAKTIADALKAIRVVYKVVSRDEDFITVDYSNANNRYAYIYYFAACHTYVVLRQAAIRLLRDPSTFYDLMGYRKEELEICSLGGGPGCDVVGLLHIRAAIGLGTTKRINCTVIDICSGWQESLKNVFSAFLNTSQGSIYRQKLRYELIKSDLLSRPPRLSVLNRLAATDILTLVKFVSALPTENSSDVLELLFDQLKPGAYVFFLDNAVGSAYNVVTSAANKAGMTVVCPLTLSQENIIKKKLSPIGPIKIKLKPLKWTYICSQVWQKY